MKPGKRMRDILDTLQDCQDDAETWTMGELWNDEGMWSASTVNADGARFGCRVQADPARRLHEQGYVMYHETRAGAGEYGADRVVFVLTEKGKRA
jgi:hypothetical protein